MTLSVHDHDRRLYDLEVALGFLVRAMAEAGHLPLVREAARKARAEGAKGAADLLAGERAVAAYRRSPPARTAPAPALSEPRPDLVDQD